MKKIITLLLAASVTGSVFAQTDLERAAGVILGGGSRETTSGPSTYPSGQYPSGDQQAEIAAVNREYDAKIASIQQNGTLSQTEKDRLIRKLNNDRNRRIAAINQRYGQSGGTYNGTGKKQKKNGKDNGNHYGWEKGKGNPHRDANWQPGNGKGRKNKG